MNRHARAGSRRAGLIDYVESNYIRSGVGSANWRGNEAHKFTLIFVQAQCLAVNTHGICTLRRGNREIPTVTKIVRNSHVDGPL